MFQCHSHVMFKIFSILLSHGHEVSQFAAVSCTDMHVETGLGLFAIAPMRLDREVLYLWKLMKKMLTIDFDPFGK